MFQRMSGPTWLVTFAAFWPYALAGAEPSPSERVDALFADLDRTDSPGCALGVIHDGELIHRRGYGMASLELGVENSPTRVYYAASVSKQFVAASVVLAAQQGKLALDDDIRKHVPEVPDYGDKITPRHLIHHTSGLRDYFSLMRLAGMRVEDIHSQAEIRQLIARQRGLNYRPGEKRSYSNSGYLLLAEIIRGATGQSLREFAQENIFEPLGMSHTHFHDDRKHVIPSRAAAYSRSPSGGFTLDWPLNLELVGSGGLLTTIEDLALWDRNFYQNRLGKKGFLEQMHETAKLNDGTETDYAFGLMVRNYRGLKMVAHGGATAGFRSNFLQVPDERFSVLLLCNLAQADPGQRAEKVAEIYLGDRLTAAPAPRKRESPQDPTAWIPSLEELERLAGSYHSDELATTYQFERQAETFRFTGMKTIDPVGLKAVSRNTFSGEGLEFVFVDDGSSFTLRAGELTNIRFVRTQ